MCIISVFYSTNILVYVCLESASLRRQCIRYEGVHWTSVLSGLVDYSQVTSSCRFLPRLFMWCCVIPFPLLVQVDVYVSLHGRSRVCDGSLKFPREIVQIGRTWHQTVRLIRQTGRLYFLRHIFVGPKLYTSSRPGPCFQTRVWSISV